MSELLKASLWYQSKGFSVIPVKSNKKPHIKWTKYQTERATGDQINAWWNKWPSANIGIVTGEISGVMVVDVDSQAGLEALENFLPDSLITPISKTSSGGWHYYFQYQKGLSNGVRVIADTDFRTDGGYVVVPPSIGEKGPYTWQEGCKISEVEPEAMPDMLFDVLQQGGRGDSANPSEHYNKKTTSRGEVTSSEVTNRNKSNISFEKGSRDNSIFHVANCLVKGGMEKDNILNCLNIIGGQCNPPFPEKEIIAKIDSAFQRQKNQPRNLTQRIRDWIKVTSGNFLVTFMYQEVTIVTSEDKNKARVILSRLVKEGLIEKVGKQAGMYRCIENEIERMDFLNADTETVNLWMPFKLHDLVEIMPGNIILIAGAPNTGKTGFLLNIIKNNMNVFDIHYFNSEMGRNELRKRLEKFDLPLSAWRFDPYPRSGNFSDVIKPGEGNINIIDFLEIHDNFYEVGGMLNEIHRKLKGAIAIVALQKNQGQDIGLGGYRSLEKPRLYLSMDSGKLKILKAKNWKTEVNPNGKEIEFKMVQGCKLIMTRDWQRAA